MTPSERARLAAKKRRLSTVRANRHGAPPTDLDEWWRQVTSIAAELGVTITWEEWSAGSKHEEPQPPKGQS